MKYKELFSEEWKYIPTSYRFIFIVGAIFIFNAWLLYNWGVNYPNVCGWNIKEISYKIGFLLILFGIVYIICKQIKTFFAFMYYRNKYPKNESNETYFLVAFDHMLILFDENKYYHISNPETARALKFFNKVERKREKFKLEPNQKVKISGTDIELDIDTYLNGGSINIID